MKGLDKIKLLKEILEDKELVSKKILKEEPEDMEAEGTLVVSAEGASPEDAKEDILAQLEGLELPDEEEMEEIMPEMEEMEEEEEEDFEMSEEDSEIMDMIPASQREAFKKRLLEKIKSL